MRGVGRRLRALRYQVTELAWYVVAPVLALFAIQQLLPDVVARLLPDPSAQLIAGAVLVMIVPIAGWIRLRPRRERSTDLIAQAVVNVLDSRLWSPRSDSAQISTGEPRTLRSLASTVTSGRLLTELGHLPRELAADLTEMRSAFDEETRCVSDTPQLRPAVLDVHAGLGEMADLLAQLAEIQNKLTWNRDGDPAYAPVVAERNELVKTLGAKVVAIVAEAARLERRIDHDGAVVRAKLRADEVARIREERRCAHRSSMDAAQILLEQVDAAGRMISDTWVSRGEIINSAYEHFAGATSIHAERMDHGTLLLVRGVNAHVFDAIKATTEAETAAKTHDEAFQKASVGFVTAIGALEETVKALRAHDPLA